MLPFPAGGRAGIASDAVFRHLDEAEREVVGVLRSALPKDTPEPTSELAAAAARLRVGMGAAEWPYPHVAAAAGWAGAPPSDDRRCCVEAAGGLVGLRDDSGLGAERESMLMALELTDWLGAVLGLVRAGVGAPASTHDLVGYLEACQEVDGELDLDDAELVESAFDLALDAWQAVGAVTADRRLTVLGVWLLPRALAWAWGADFDA